jgi:probable metal-binding protein
MTTYHAHELLEKIAFAEQAQTFAAWREFAVAQFGADAIFENCGGLQMDVDRVFEFFVHKGKVFVDEQGLVQPQRENICSGHGHHH